MTNKSKVPLFGQPQKHTTVENGATVGAILGENLFYPNGTLVKLSDFGSSTPSTPGTQVVMWSLILQVPPNVQALAATSTTGLYTITGAGTSATRTIEGDGATISVIRGDGVAGNPVISAINPYAIFLTDEAGNFLTDEAGNLLIAENGFPINPDFLPAHNSLNGLQGGNDAERYHLTAAQASELAAILAAAPINVTGSRGGNAALASLLTALATIGLITDGTTA